MSASDNPIPAAIYERLTTTAAIADALAEGPDGEPAVFEDQAPQDQEGPLIVFHAAAGGPEYGLGDTIAWEDGIYNVKVIVEGLDAVPADELRAEVRTALTGSVLNISGHQQIELHRLSKIEYPENDNGKSWLHRGDSYRIWFS